MAALAITTILFAWADTSTILLWARHGQGVAAGIACTACILWLLSAWPIVRRGVPLGAAMGPAVIGTVAGPSIGTLALQLGVRMPYRLRDLGAPDQVSGLTFLAAVVVTVVVARPLGRMVDRFGADRTTMVGLFALAVFLPIADAGTYLVSFVVVVLMLAINFCYVSVGALLTRGGPEAGLVALVRDGAERDDLEPRRDGGCVVWRSRRRHGWVYVEAGFSAAVVAAGLVVVVVMSRTKSAPRVNMPGRPAETVV
jgi:MFS family permease